MGYHPSVIDRYYASIIYENALSKEDRYSMYEPDLQDTSLRNSASLPLSNSGYYIGEALLLTGEFGRAWRIFSDCYSGDMDIPCCLKNEFETQIGAFKLITAFLSGNITKRRTIEKYLELQQRPLPFLSENYFSLFMLTIKYLIFTKPSARKEIQESLNKTIEKTGFYYYRDFHARVTG